MDLLRSVLDGVSDTRLLSDHKEGATPLRHLISEYTAKALHNDNAPNLTELSTGADLKAGIEKLEIEDQVIMLSDYLEKCKRIVPRESADQIEERKLKTFAIKSFIYVSITVVVLFIGSVTTIAVRSGRLPSNEVLSTFLEFAGEIAGLIWEK
ncbi:MAG: hypothetical protein P4L77_11445 [Sulfuriferula sp.]|nr:hypothetical protein [Sulfuriferula sp.]